MKLLSKTLIFSAFGFFLASHCPAHSAAVKGLWDLNKNYKQQYENQPWNWIADFNDWVKDKNYPQDILSELKKEKSSDRPPLAEMILELVSIEKAMRFFDPSFRGIECIDTNFVMWGLFTFEKRLPLVFGSDPKSKLFYSFQNQALVTHKEFTKFKLYVERIKDTTEDTYNILTKYDIAKLSLAKMLLKVVNDLGNVNSNSFMFPVSLHQLLHFPAGIRIGNKKDSLTLLNKYTSNKLLMALYNYLPGNKLEWVKSTADHNYIFYKGSGRAISYLIQYFDNDDSTFGVDRLYIPSLYDANSQEFSDGLFRMRKDRKFYQKNGNINDTDIRDTVELRKKMSSEEFFAQLRQEAMLPAKGDLATELMRDLENIEINIFKRMSYIASPEFLHDPSTGQIDGRIRQHTISFLSNVKGNWEKIDFVDRKLISAKFKQTISINNPQDHKTYRAPLIIWGIWLNTAFEQNNQFLQSDSDKTHKYFGFEKMAKMLGCFIKGDPSFPVYETAENTPFNLEALEKQTCVGPEPE